MNEQTHFFIKIYLSRFILERVNVGCVWEMSWRWGQTTILTQQYFFLILVGLLNRGSLRAQSPLSAAGSQFGILSPTDCFSKIPKFSAHCFRTWHHSHSSPISYLGFIMTIVIVIYSARERILYPMSVHLN